MLLRRQGTPTTGRGGRRARWRTGPDRRLRRGTVEGSPENADSVPAGFLFNGALSTIREAGVHRSREIGKHRWVVTTLVKPKSSYNPHQRHESTPRVSQAQPASVVTQSCLAPLLRTTPARAARRVRSFTTCLVAKPRSELGHRRS